MPLTLFMFLVQKLQSGIDEHRPVIDDMNQKGDKLIAISPGQGAAEVRQQCSDANKRFTELCAQTKDIEYRLSAMLEGAQKVITSLSPPPPSLRERKI